MADPYADPYSTAAAVTVGPPQDYGDAAAYDPVLRKYQTAFDEREKQREGVEAKQQLNVDQMSTLLEDAAKTIRKNREGRSNLPMIAAGAAMMGTPGDFGTQVGAGLRAMVPQIQKQREDEDNTEITLAKLGTQAGEIRNMPLKEKLDYLKAMQTGDMATIRAIETAQIRAQAQQAKAAGHDPAMVKEWEAAKKDPRYADITYPDFVKLRTELTTRTAESERLIAKVMADDPTLTYPQAMAKAKELQAAGTTTGREQAEAKVKAQTTLGRTEQGIAKGTAAIDDLLKNPDAINNFVGRGQGRITQNAPGLSQDRQNFANRHAYLVDQLFTQAIAPLIGTGAGSLSDAEGKALASGFANLKLTNDPELFKKGLADLRVQLAQTLEDARRRSRGEPMQAPPPTTPTPGTPTPPGQTGAPGGGTGGKPWERY